MGGPIPFNNVLTSAHVPVSRISSVNLSWPDGCAD